MKMRTVTFVLLIGFLVLIPQVRAQDQRGDPTVGKQLFRSFCSVCHGNDGKTKGPLAEKLGLHPADLTSSNYQKMSVDELVVLIGRYGQKVEGSQMPRWGEAVPEENLRKIASYIHLLTQTELRFTGDTRRGRVIFQNSCSACHGPRGTGNGALAKLLNVKMVDFTDTSLSDWVKDEDILKVVREGRGEFMPAWKGALSEDEIVDVSAYVRSLHK